MAYVSASVDDTLGGLGAAWVVTAAVSILLAVIAMAILSGFFWVAGWFGSMIVPTFDEHSRRLRGKDAWRRFRYRARVRLGFMSFFPYRADVSWKPIIRFHLIIMAGMCFQEVFGILLNEGDPRPLHLSLLAFFLPSILMFSGASFTRITNAGHGYAKRRGSGPVMAHRYFTDEEIADRLRNERRHAEMTRKYWERQHER